MSLVVVKALGLITVQDLGRRGHMHEGLPPGGALVPAMLVRANRTVGNPDGAAAIEVCGELVVRAERDVIVGTDRTSAVELRSDGEMGFASDSRRVIYLAVRGAIDVPIVLGGRGAHLSAGIGSLIRAGDRIALTTNVHDNATDTHHATDTRHATEDTTRLHVLPGPDADAFAPDALATLCASTYRISSSSNRVGTRLEGPAIARRADYEERSRPMVIGAIEVPRDGAPIVLGPEHPTTGGYPILAVVSSRDLDALHSIALGRTVRFRL